MVEKRLWLRRRWNLMSSVINRKIKFSGILDFYFAGSILTFSQEEFGVANVNMQTSPKERLKGGKKQGANKDGPLVGNVRPPSHAVPPSWSGMCRESSPHLLSRQVVFTASNCCASIEANSHLFTIFFPSWEKGRGRGVSSEHSQLSFCLCCPKMSSCGPKTNPKKALWSFHLVSISFIQGKILRIW